MENDITTIEPLVQSVSNSIKDETIRAGGNIMEVGLDKILNEGLLKDIPFCSTVISVYHIGTGIRDSHYIKS